jgi:hypothetical protein
MRVLSFGDCAESGNFSLRTLQREIAEGRGPAVVEISARRRGVLEADFHAWLLSRRRPAPSENREPPKRGRGRPRKEDRSGEAA